MEMNAMTAIQHKYSECQKQICEGEGNVRRSWYSRAIFFHWTQTYHFQEYAHRCLWLKQETSEAKNIKHGNVLSQTLCGMNARPIQKSVCYTRTGAVLA